MKNKLFENSVVYICDGKEVAADFAETFSADDERCLVWRDERIALCRQIKGIKTNVYRVTDTYKNIGEKGDFIFVLEVNAGYAPDFTLVPAVSYDGNRFGESGEPKGLTKDGEPWIFGYTRTALPSATVTEGIIDGCRMSTAVMASAENKESLISGGSIYIGDDGNARQRVYRPEIEAPKTYAYKEGYMAPRYDKVTLDAGEEFTAVSYVISGEPKYRRFGVEDAYRVAYENFNMSSAPVYDDEKVWRLAVDHTKNLLVNGDGGNLFVTGLNAGKRDENGHHGYVQTGGDHELGWCGQNSTLMLAYITDYIKFGNEESLKIAERAIDAWLKHGTLENGWLASHIRRLDSDEVRTRENADTVNTGYGAMQMMKAAKLLTDNGMSDRGIMDKMIALCELYIRLWSDELGMPSAISKAGEAASYVGTGGLFAGFALTTAYRYTNDERYLELAKKLVMYYEERDLELFACAAGALDTSCVDKESCCPFLHVALDIYEFTGEKKWLETAHRAAIYLSTWMFTFDSFYPEDSNFVKMGFNTKGGTVVSAKHQHIDPWGGVISADMTRYAKLSGDEMYAAFGRLMWDHVTQAIADGVTPDPRGNIRPIGSQGEAYMHTHWNFSRPEDGFAGGYINDWLVAWPAAHRMATLMRKWNGEI